MDGHRTKSIRALAAAATLLLAIGCRKQAAPRPTTNAANRVVSLSPNTTEALFAVGANLPVDFAAFAAYGDFATGLLAMLALLTIRMRPLFWLFVVAFNVVGAVDIIVDYYHGNQIGLPALAGELGAGYAIPIIYVPLLMITHVVAFYLVARPQPEAVRLLAGPAAAS